MHVGFFIPLPLIEEKFSFYPNEDVQNNKYFENVRRKYWFHPAMDLEYVRKLQTLTKVSIQNLKTFVDLRHCRVTLKRQAVNNLSAIRAAIPRSKQTPAAPLLRFIVK